MRCKKLLMKKKKMKISDYKFQEQLPASTDREPEEIIETTWRYAEDFSGITGIGLMLLVSPFVLWIAYKLLEILWIIFSGLFVCTFLGC